LEAPLEEAVQYQKKDINSNLFDQNPFKGTPSPELDAAWDDILDGLFIS
jgi:hypothetical protein